MTTEITLDGNAFSDLPGFYDEVERKLTRDLGWRMGRNLDAFNDILRGGFGVFDEGRVHIIWEAAAKSQADLGYPATAAFWTQVLAKCHPTNQASVQAKIDQAQRHEGPTLFDVIADIMREHDMQHIDLELRT